SWELMHGLNLLYASTATSLTSDTGSGQKTLTLSGVQRIGKDGSALPATTFTYGTSMGNSLEPTPGWNRLATVDNGQGGKLTFSYEHVWTLAQNPPGENYVGDYQNYYRVTQTLAQDLSGSGKSALTTYSYGAPTLNNENNAASVFYAHYPPSLNGDSRTFLAHGEKREFRGHTDVTERHYDGATTGAALLQEIQHWFYQGGASAIWHPC